MRTTYDIVEIAERLRVSSRGLLINYHRKWKDNKMEMEDNKRKVTEISAEQMRVVVASQILVQTALTLLQDAGISSRVLIPFVGEEKILANKYTERQKREASRKRVARLVKRLLAANPEENAKIKAERYPALTAVEIERVEKKVQEKLQKKEIF